MINHDLFQKLVKQLYETVADLENMFEGRHFTPDGHMVGSLGECLVADAYGLDLARASNKGFDAITKSGLKVEIKATQGNRVSFRNNSAHAIIIRILPDGTFEEVFNGPGSVIWKQFEGKKLPSNGQHQISVSMLRKLAKLIPEEDILQRVY